MCVYSCQPPFIVILARGQIKSCSTATNGCLMVKNPKIDTQTLVKHNTARFVEKGEESSVPQSKHLKRHCALCRNKVDLLDDLTQKLFKSRTLSPEYGDVLHQLGKGHLRWLWCGCGGFRICLQFQNALMTIINEEAQVKINTK